MEENKKYYSQRSISVATYLGGPLVAGFLIKKNYQTLKEEGNAKKAMLIGIAATLFIFGSVFSIPESVFDKIPNMLIPAIYTGIIYLIVEKTQGERLKRHKENGGEFHSGWKAAGLGGISLVVILASIVLLIVVQDEIVKSGYDFKTYEREFTQFKDNESQSLKVFDLIGSEAPDKSKVELQKGIVLWKENKMIIEKLNLIENLPEDLRNQNKLFSSYCDLRIKHYELFIKTLEEDTEKYLPEIEQITNEINETLKMDS